MKSLLNLIIILFLSFNICYSQSDSTIDLHIKEYQPKKLNFYDFKYPMNSPFYYFHPEISNWEYLRLNAKFIFYTKNGIVILNIGIPGSPQSIFNGIKLN